MGARPTVLVQEDQLRPDLDILPAPGEATVLMIESLAWARRLPWHRQRLTFVWSAMRHFADELRAAGHTVDYHAACPDVRTALEAAAPTHLRLMATAEHGLADQRAAVARDLGITVEVAPNAMFISDREGFRDWANGRKTLLLETFYRDQRRRTGLLMTDGQPAGNRWNFDKLNRRPPPDDRRFPEAPRFHPDQTTREIMDLVRREFPDHFGDLDSFAWPVTRRDAEAARDDFLDHRLAEFGPYQDAMVSGQRTLYHSLLSPLLNVGLLDPLDLCRRVETRWRNGGVPLNSAEGFIRQVIGWREFVYQVYHYTMPGYLERNTFAADLPLPGFFWDGDTDMHCLAQAIRAVVEDGINHHIQRLMLTGNFALLAGIDPRAVNDWYLFAYIDSWEWVVSPNVYGLALFADEGLVATKPYAASANYIHRMSDYCANCRYRHTDRIGEDACPFNALYWDFLARNRELLAGNPRLNLTLANLDKQDPEQLTALRARANALRAHLAAGHQL